MKSKLLSPLAAVILFLSPLVNFGQSPPPLGSTSSFALFTAAGAFTNSGASTSVIGDVGTNVGAFSAFPPGILVGQIHTADPASAQAATDVDLAYGSMSTITCGSVISTTMGNGQILLPNVYCLGAASTINGDLILDGQGDPSSLFIFKIDGALATTVGSRILLTNSASICNVYWQVNGEVDLGEASLFQGTILANGAINLLEAATLNGRGLSRAGAISLHNNLVTLGLQPTASIITASGAITFCAGGSVTLLGNIGGTWSNGATTASITVNTSGNYSVTNTTTCGSVISNVIAVTVNPLPVCTITGNLSICQGQSTELCAPAGTGYTYLWSTGATTRCITVSAAGSYTVTITDANGCSSTCSQTVIVTQTPVCTITGNETICPGGSTQLCVPAGASGYLWSTGATTNCITVNAAGTYSVTVTNAGGCVSTCSKIVIVTQTPVCTITGNASICPGGSTQLCVPAGASGYLWSTGATTNCITVNAAGTYSVTVTNAGGCVSTCSKIVIVTQTPVCTITGNASICPGGSTQLCASAGTGFTYLWSNGATTRCITVTAAGTYSVTVNNGSGCISTCSKAITVNTAPTCTITGNNTICPGGSTQLCASAGTGYTYLWSNGATTRCITVTAAGTYSVTVNNGSGCISTCSKAITVNTAPTCTITGNNTICPGGSTQLCASAGTGYTYLWSNGATTPCITVTAAGSYSVTVNNGSGCISTCSKTVTVKAGIPCTITGNGSICQGQSTELCAPAGCVSYLWSNGKKTRCITVTAAGTYSVTVDNGSGCVSTCSKTVTITPGIPCTITGNGSICQGQSTELCAPAGCVSYLWSNGKKTRCITVTAAGTYSVTIDNGNGCVSTCSKTVTVTPGIPCTITGNSSICQGQSTELCAPAGCSSYLWSNGKKTRCITVTTAGTYSVTVNNGSGCISTCSKTVTVTPGITCTITGNGTICEGESIQLCAPAGCASYLWSNGKKTRCITISKAGTYSVTIDNGSGCISTCSKTITLTQALKQANTAASATSQPAESNPKVKENKSDAYGLVEVKAYPNPFTAKAIIEFRNTTADSHVVIEFCSLAGNKIATVFDRKVDKGVLYKAEVNGENISAGIYVCRIINGDQIIHRKLILIK